MRGKRNAVNQTLNNVRIIPAHAGQTSRLLRLCFASADHPRACGANYSLALSGVFAFGSSPRMRGKRPR